MASPGSGASGTVIATGSGAVAVSHRAACRQKNSYDRFDEATSIFQRHDASPANTIERPCPYRWTATTGYTPPPGAVVTAKTGAPAASAGRLDQILRVSPMDAPIRMIGCVSPSLVSVSLLWAGMSPVSAAR